MFRVSCIQLKSNNNINHNLKKTEKLIIKAVKQKTDFILTPEVSSLFSLNKKQLLKICKPMSEDIYLKGIKNLAKQIKNKSFNPNLIPKLDDEEAILYLSNLRQIGRWSAEMILLFTYNRSNIWPIQDIGLLRAISKNYKKKYLPPEKFVKNLKAGSAASVLFMMLKDKIWLVDTNGILSKSDMSEIAAQHGLTKLDSLKNLSAKLEVRIQPRGLNSPKKHASIDAMASFRLAKAPAGGGKVI